MVICLERGADLHMAQLMTLPLTVSCFSKIQTGFTFLVPAHLGSPEKGPLNVCVCVCVCVCCSIRKRSSRQPKNKQASKPIPGPQSTGEKTHVVNVKTRSDVTLYLNRLSETSKTPAQREQQPAANW